MSLTIIAISSGVLGCVIGVPLMMAGTMAFGAGPATSLSMKIIGYSSLSTIPVTLIGSISTIITQNPYFLMINLIPVVGIATAFCVEKFNSKNIQIDNTTNVTNTPPVI